MGTRYCICQSIPALTRMIAKGIEIDWLFDGETHKQLTTQEICEVIVECKAKGYSVIPPCDNITSTGHCAGHPI